MRVGTFDHVCEEQHCEGSLPARTKVLTFQQVFHIMRLIIMIVFTAFFPNRYELMGTRFAELAFGPRGILLPGRVAGASL